MDDALVSTRKSQSTKLLDFWFQYRIALNRAYAGCLKSCCASANHCAFRPGLLASSGLPHSASIRPGAGWAERGDHVAPGGDEVGWRAEDRGRVHVGLVVEREVHMTAEGLHIARPADQVRVHGAPLASGRDRGPGDPRPVSPDRLDGQ